MSFNIHCPATLLLQSQDTSLICDRKAVREDLVMMIDVRRIAGLKSASRSIAAVLMAEFGIATFLPNVATAAISCEVTCPLSGCSSGIGCDDGKHNVTDPCIGVAGAAGYCQSFQICNSILGYACCSCIPSNGNAAPTMSSWMLGLMAALLSILGLRATSDMWTRPPRIPGAV